MSASPCARWRSGPGTSALLVATLAVGLAANGVVFNFLDAMVLRPFPFPNVPQLVRVWETGRGNDDLDRTNLAPANLRDIEAQAGGALSEVAAIQWWDATLAGSFAAEEGARLAGVARVSSRCWASVSRTAAFRGGRGPDGPGPRAVVGHALWQRVFGGPADRRHVDRARRRALRGRRHRAAGVPVPGRHRVLGSARPAAGRARPSATRTTSR